MSSEWQLDNGIHLIKSAWRREHTARVNLEKMLEQAEAENAKLRELNESMWLIIRCATSHTSTEDGLPVIHEDDLAMLRSMRRDLGIEVDG